MLCTRYIKRRPAITAPWAIDDVSEFALTCDGSQKLEPDEDEFMRRCAFAVGLCFVLLASFPAAAQAEPQWLTLPPTPSLPTPIKSGSAPVNGIKIWYAVFGHGPPVILLHGGLANAN